MPTNRVVEVIQTKDNLQSLTARWLFKATVKGTILLCQGYSKFIEKYDEVISLLNIIRKKVV